MMVLRSIYYAGLRNDETRRACTVYKIYRDKVREVQKQKNTN
ncbi:hypothetical protein E9Y_05802 [Moraxella catarrhalis 101P30B1]|nr:hypothetical protein E9G_07335 [Moraxella catarrhalis 7169]EGE24398.1 hypothetical protein E9Y_05802 [Moraxella catarrhalis 101P30B1]